MDMGIMVTRLHGVWGTSDIDVYSVGDSRTIVHFDGISWSVIMNSVSEIFYGVWGLSDSNVYAVGSSEAVLHYTCVVPPVPAAEILHSLLMLGLLSIFISFSMNRI
jgi:hypothetical protein